MSHGDPTIAIGSAADDGPRGHPAPGLDAHSLGTTLYFSFRQYLPLRGGDLGFAGFSNYYRFVTATAFWPSVQATLIIVGGVLVITVILGILLALLLDQPMWGQGIVRILVIAPFFVMPTVSALVWKNMFMDP
jgi:sorbitol/mannitol transport system permease protein